MAKSEIWNDATADNFEHFHGMLQNMDLPAAPIFVTGRRWFLKTMESKNADKLHALTKSLNIVGDDVVMVTRDEIAIKSGNTTSDYAAEIYTELNAYLDAAQTWKAEQFAFEQKLRDFAHEAQKQRAEYEAQNKAAAPVKTEKKPKKTVKATSARESKQKSTPKQSHAKKEPQYATETVKTAREKAVKAGLIPTSKAQIDDSIMVEALEDRRNGTIPADLVYAIGAGAVDPIPRNIDPVDVVSKRIEHGMRLN